jgi:hypothetical protein
MSAQSRFGICQINVAPIGFEVRLTKHTQVAAGSRVLPIALRDGRQG